MENRNFNEKNEKDEKDREKHDEKTMEEKWRRDPLSRITWAIVLIWGGLVFLAANLGYLNTIPTNVPGGAFIPYMGAWGVFMVGAGLLLLIEVLVRLAIPAYRAPIGGTFFLALVFIGIGAGNWFGWDVIWPFILIALGLSILMRAFWRR